MKPRPIHFIAGFSLLFLLLAAGRAYFPLAAERSALLMGTPVTVTVSGPRADRLAGLALDEIRRLERELLRDSADYQACLKQAKKLRRVSGGAFDPRYGGEVDLRGIGKGYAVEAARALLMKNGAKSGMIDMRSSIAFFGSRSWRIGVQDPRDREKMLGVLVLTGGQSLATSGDYERGRHIIDPRSGRPAGLCRAVTVVGQNAAETDALSTALFVLGPVEGLALAASLPGIEALIVDARGEVHRTAGFNLEEQ